MKQLIFSVFCLCTTGAFAQNGFFIQAQGGGGMSNVCESQYQFGNGQTKNISSYQGALQLGYHAGKWDITTGLGYLRTGYQLKGGNEPGPLLYGASFTPGTADQVFGQMKVSDPHIIVPLKVGYELFHLSQRLTFEPVLGAEFAYNMPRTFSNNLGYKRKETQLEFDDYCHTFGAMGVIELNFKYKTSNRLEFMAGPSVQYNFISEQKYGDQYDYSVLMNLSMRYDFHKRNYAN